MYVLSVLTYLCAHVCLYVCVFLHEHVCRHLCMRMCFCLVQSTAQLCLVAVLLFKGLEA